MNRIIPPVSFAAKAKATDIFCNSYSPVSQTLYEITSDIPVAFHLML